MTRYCLLDICQTFVGYCHHVAMSIWRLPCIRYFLRASAMGVLEYRAWIPGKRAGGVERSFVKVSASQLVVSVNKSDYKLQPRNMLADEVIIDDVFLYEHEILGFS